MPCVCVHMYECAHMLVHMWRSDNLGSSGVLSFIILIFYQAHVWPSPMKSAKLKYLVSLLFLSGQI